MRKFFTHKKQSLYLLLDRTLQTVMVCERDANRMTSFFWTAHTKNTDTQECTHLLTHTHTLLAQRCLEIYFYLCNRLSLHAKALFIN